MRGFFAIFGKEAASFFVSPIAYAVIVIFLLITGFIFWANVSYMSLISLQATSNPMIAERINVTDFIIKPLIQNIGFILLFMTPMLTMRSFSEEKKSGTIELLLTYPVSYVAVLLGKFAGALLVLIAMLLSTVPSVLLLFGLSQPDLGVVLSGYLGLLFMGAALVALGLFISSLTENQIIAAVVSFGAVLLFWILSWTSATTEERIGSFLKQLSILERMEAFSKGVISLPDMTYFALFTIFFLFMSLRSLEAHRWRG